MEDLNVDKQIKFVFGDKSYYYTKDRVKELNIESFDNLFIDDEPLSYIYKISIRNNPVNNFIVYTPYKSFVLIKESVDYFN